MTSLPLKTAIVLPTIREESLVQFAHEWRTGFADATVIVVEDNARKSFPIDRDGWQHFCHEDIDRELGADAWIVPRKTDCVRSFGILKALEMGAEVIVSLDDDCYPAAAYPNLIETHVQRLMAPEPAESWFSTCTHFKPRGIPYFASTRSLPVAVNHGLWEDVPDFDAPTQLLHQRLGFEAGWIDATVPKGLYYPMCGMNVAFRRAIAPCFYFLLMGQGYPFDRFGDIWSGIIAKKVCDHLNFGVRTGAPAIRHARASNVWKNLIKEAPGLEWNEQFWQAVDNVVLTGTTASACYTEVADGVATLAHPYFTELASAMKTWARLCDRVASGRLAVSV